MEDSGQLSITTITDEESSHQLSILRVEGAAKSMFVERLSKKALAKGSPIVTGGSVNKSALLNVLGAIGWPRNSVQPMFLSSIPAVCIKSTSVFLDIVPRETTELPFPGFAALSNFRDDMVGYTL